MEPTPQGGDGEDIVIDTVVPVASILPLGVPRVGVGGGAARERKSPAREAPAVGALAMVEPMPASRNGRPGPGREREISMAAANGVRGRAPGLVSAFTAAPNKRFSPSLPTWRAPVGRAAPHSSHVMYNVVQERVQGEPSRSTVRFAVCSLLLPFLGAVYSKFSFHKKMFRPEHGSCSVQKATTSCPSNRSVFPIDEIPGASSATVRKLVNHHAPHHARKKEVVILLCMQPPCSPHFCMK
jgi:hypothetical protein